MVAKTEWNRLLAEARVEGGPVEVPEKRVGVADLHLVSLESRVGAGSEALLRIEQQHRVPGEPVAERPRERELRGVDGRLRDRAPDLVRTGRMAHEVAELVVAVALLVVGNRGHRPVHVEPVRLEGSIPAVLEDEARLGIDPGGRIEDRGAERRVEAEQLRGTRFAPRVLRLRGRRQGHRPLGLERVELPSELAVLLLEPFEPLDEALERGRMGAVREERERHGDDEGESSG